MYNWWKLRVLAESDRIFYQLPNTDQVLCLEIWKALTALYDINSTAKQLV